MKISRTKMVKSSGNRTVSSIVIAYHFLLCIAPTFSCPHHMHIMFTFVNFLSPWLRSLKRDNIFMCKETCFSLKGCSDERLKDFPLCCLIICYNQCWDTIIASASVHLTHQYIDVPQRKLFCLYIDSFVKNVPCLQECCFLCIDTHLV